MSGKIRSICRIFHLRLAFNGVNASQNALRGSSREYSTLSREPRSPRVSPSPSSNSKRYCRISDGARSVMDFYEFGKVENKNKEEFEQLIRMYDKNFPTRKGVVDFVYAAVRAMKDFGVEDDLEMYKKIFSLFPKGKYVAKNPVQVIFKHHPREQQCAMYLLDKLEANGVMPDDELGDLIVETFGKHSDPAGKYLRALYWMPKFSNKSPWKLPKKMSTDPFDLAMLAIERITSVDLQTKISVYRTEDVEASIDKTWIVSGQSPEQAELLMSHDPKKPVIVEGGDHVWIAKHRVNYFALKSESVPYVYRDTGPAHDVSNLESNHFRVTYEERKETSDDSVHVQEDGRIYAVCATGTSSEDSLLSWVRLLEERGNPILKDLAVLFRFKKPPAEPVPYATDLVKNEDSVR